MRPNFVEIIKILNNNKISNWVCHGMLLVLIKDSFLID